MSRVSRGGGSGLGVLVVLVGGWYLFHHNTDAAAATGPTSAIVAQEQSYAASLFPAHSWGPDQLGPLVKLWNQESGWNAYAVNPSSGADGIPQELGHGHPYALGDWQAQIQWGEDYIAQRYGSPAGAWAHEQANNWY